MNSRPPILVVDDDAPILMLMRSLLREFGFEAVTAATGEEAVAAARDRRPALVLLDRNMPGMHGDEVVRALREDVGLDGVPILILSGDPVTRSELAQLGVDGAVQKPFDVPTLIAQIRGYVTADA
ncbi:MAG: adenylate cyclase [Acidobacteriota bacterium]|jgi:DNA-binding response OmpR family regulator|nr:adenylate cyclase [Acidobacteriota bacterium]